MSEPLKLFRSLLARLEAGGACALCTVVTTRGSTPQTAGAMLLVHISGDTEGTIGGGCVEADVRRQALAMLGRVRETHQSPADAVRFTHPTELLTFQLDQNYGWDDGLICGGRMDVAVVCLSDVSQAAPFVEAIARIECQEPACVPLRVRHEGKLLEYRLNVEPTPTLLIAGAGHVGAALAKLAVGLGFRVVVFDDRGDLLDRLAGSRDSGNTGWGGSCTATPQRTGDAGGGSTTATPTGERLPPPIETVAGDIETQLRQWSIDANTYVVIVTRGHAYDGRSLGAVIGSPAKYLGMIGSRRKIQVIFDDLESRGIQRANLARVHAPIGLKIAAVSVPEIAVSIAAELIAVRRAKSRQAVEGPFEVDDRGAGCQPA
jgi:xanthine dehydrogenase accessory factor